MMKKQFYLEGERIILRCAKELIGREQYKKTLSNAKAAFLRNPLREVRYMTHEGMLTIVFQPD